MNTIDKSKISIYISGYNTNYYSSKHENTIHWTGYRQVYSLEEADILVLPGGADINPFYYNDPVYLRTYFYDLTDQRQLADLQAAVLAGKPILGICRGGQMLTVASGGKLIQDVSHGGSHGLLVRSLAKKITAKSPFNILITTNSIHHQMFYPYNLHPCTYVPLGTVPTSHRSKHHVLGTKKIVFEENELEIVYYPLLKGIAVQGHPEMMPSAHFGQYVTECLDLIVANEMDEKCGVNIKKIYAKNTFEDTSSFVRSFLLNNKDTIIAHHEKKKQLA